MHNRKITLRYFGELLGANLFFFLVEALSRKLTPAMPPGIGRTLVLLGPGLPVLLMIAVIVRYYFRVDEYLRLKMLECFALTAAITFAGTFLYGLFEAMGFPRLSMFAICPAMGSACLMVGLIQSITSRRSS